MGGREPVETAHRAAFAPGRVGPGGFRHTDRIGAVPEGAFRSTTFAVTV